METGSATAAALGASHFVPATGNGDHSDAEERGQSKSSRTALRKEPLPMKAKPAIPKGNSQPA